jgi:hypothetical protein
LTIPPPRSASINPRLTVSYRRHEALIANGFAFRKAGESLDFENTHKPTLSINYSYLNYQSRNDIRRINPQTRPSRASP